MKQIFTNGIYIVVYGTLLFVIFVLSVGFQFFNTSVISVIGGTCWVLLYLVLPLFIFIVPLVAKFLFKCNFKKAIFVSIISVLIYVILTFGTIFTVHEFLEDFTSNKWKKYPNERYLMLDDMAEEIKFIGMTKENVIEILGEPTSPYADTEDADLIEYYIGAFSIDPTMVTFVFENNEVTEVYEYTEFRIHKKSLY